MDNKIIKEIESKLKKIFGQDIYSFYDNKVGRQCFVILNEKLYYDNRFTAIKQIETEYIKYHNYYMISWDILNEYQEKKIGWMVLDMSADATLPLAPDNFMLAA